MELGTIVLVGLGVVTLGVAAGAINIIRPTERGLVERLGKYHRFAESGLNLTIPIIEKMERVDVTERMVDVEQQEIITKDKLNATVDAQVYFKVKPVEENVKNAMYNVANYEYQIVQLARTTLRNIIGTMNLTQANTERGEINDDLMETLAKETKTWGIEIVRTELKEINPPKDVQDTMNGVVIAENKKVAALDLATAAETEADGKRRVAIKQAEGVKQARILEAEGEAAAIKTVNEAAEKYFVGNAQKLKQLEVTQAALENNTKIIVAGKTDLVNVIGETAGVVPTKRRE